jgi:hypothetical protein
MIHICQPAVSVSSQDWACVLASRGFAASNGLFRRKGLCARVDRVWLTLVAETPTPCASWSPGEMDRAGLWKRVGHGSRQRLRFDFPVAGATSPEAAEDLDEPGRATPEVIVDWALSTVKNQPVSGWQAPARELVESWLAPGALTVRMGAIVRQVELTLSANRWGLRLPILPALPAQLSPERLRALQHLAADAQEQHRMVRVGFGQAAMNQGLVAVVDLSGAPHSEFLFSTGLGGVITTVARLVDAADLLADASLALRTLQVRPWQNKP